MCNDCYNYDFVCETCGTILNEEYSHIVGYFANRKMLKDLMKTSNEESFVWFLRYNGKIVKVGFGSLSKLFNETKPNANYIKFDTVFIYYCNSKDERDIFATASMGYIDGIVNKKAVPNKRYIGKTDLVFKNTVPPYIRKIVLTEPDLVIGNNIYWDAYRLKEEGYV